MSALPDEYQDLTDWLIESALTEVPIQETLREFGERLLAAGIPTHRINCSTFQRHQIMGAVDTTWDSDRGVHDTEFIPKSVIMSHNITNTPAGELARSGLSIREYDLCDAEVRSRFTMLQSLSERGYTDYMILNKSYGRTWNEPGLDHQSEGVYGSFATRNIDGFSKAHKDTIKGLWPYFSLYLKTATERLLSARLLEAYVGVLPARNILNGMIELGDGSRINCVLWFSDLRGSTHHSNRLSADSYLKLLNDYFNCTAGAVIDHGGEVLKLIGDGVMAIFPFQAGTEADACSRALAAAQASLQMAREIDQPDLQFGIGLHIGEGTLGNIGTATRLDMTVTGLSANQVTRVEALTKLLPVSVLASPQFCNATADQHTSIGEFSLPDFGGMT